MRFLPSFLWLDAAALCSFNDLGRELATPRPAGLVYAWQPQTLAARFPAPTGCQRGPVAAGSWGE